MNVSLDRAVLLVLDGVGCGALPDAAQYGAPDADPLANCLSNVARAVGGLTLPHLGALGVGNITPIAGTAPPLAPPHAAHGEGNDAAHGERNDAAHGGGNDAAHGERNDAAHGGGNDAAHGEGNDAAHGEGNDAAHGEGNDAAHGGGQIQGSFGKMAEASAGKDSTTGHWEIAGLITAIPFPTYPQGFPPEVIARFAAAIGRKILGNYPASGTAIIEDLGAEHMRTGYPIVYTSADSVFQIAAHEDVVPVAELYHWCQLAREQLGPPHAVGRVIARPFTGAPGNFTRTPRRRDFSLPPPGPTLLDALRAAGYDVIGLGKIGDLFTERGLTQSAHPGTDAETMARALDWLERDWRGLLFVNLVECDQVYGHRRNPAGYARTLQTIDAWLPAVQERLGPRDTLFITGDHGTDPTVSGTDHTREYVPLLAVGGPVRAGVDLGTRSSFADLGATIAEAFGVNLGAGNSFWHDITG